MTHLAGALTCALAISLNAAAAADVEAAASRTGTGIGSLVDAPVPAAGGDIFHAPDPDPEHGAANAADVRFDFTGDIDLCEIDLIEAIGREPTVFTLIASAGAVHTYAVAPRPGYDVAVYGPAACDPLDLALFTRPRAGIGGTRASSAPPLVGGGMRLEVRFTSVHRDEVGFIPAPGSALLAVMGAVGLVRRRRR